MDNLCVHLNWATLRTISLTYNTHKNTQKHTPSLSTGSTSPGLHQTIPVKITVCIIYQRMTAERKQSAVFSSLSPVWSIRQITEHIHWMQMAPWKHINTQNLICIILFRCPSQIFSSVTSKSYIKFFPLLWNQLSLNQTSVGLDWRLNTPKHLFSF